MAQHHTSNQMTEAKTTEVLSRQQRRFIERKGRREAGFEAVTNIDEVKRFQGLYMLFIQQGLEPDNAYNTAMSRFRSSLPLPRMGMKFHRRKPSKSDNPEYRQPTFTKEARRAVAAQKLAA